MSSGTTTDFTVDNRRVFMIAGPAMLANLTTPLLGVVSTAAVGRLGDPHILGGVAMAAVAFDCIFWLFGFLRMATVAFTAQSLGAGNRIEVRAIFFRAMLLALLIGTALIILRTPLASGVFTIMGGSEAVTAAAREYFFIRLWSAPLMLGNYVILGWLVGQTRTGRALALQVGINIINMLLTALLVLQFDFGIKGAAIATVAAETIGFLAGLAVVWHQLEKRIGVSRAAIFERASLLRLFAVNRDIMIRTAALITAFLFFTAQGARSGDLILAANAVLGNFVMIGSFFLDGLATAAEQICGQALGAKSRQRFTRAVNLTLIWSAAFGVTTTALFMLFGTELVALITTSLEVRAVAGQYMWLAALAPVCGVFAYCYDGIYIGASWVRDMRNLMLVALASYGLVWLLLESQGNTGLWLSFLLFLSVRGILQAWRFPAMLNKTFKASP